MPAKKRTTGVLQSREVVADQPESQPRTSGRYRSPHQRKQHNAFLRHILLPGFSIRLL